MKFHILVLAATLSAPLLAASIPVEIGQLTDMTLVEGKAWVFLDSSGALTISDILANDTSEFFTPNERSPLAFGYLSDAVWLRFDVTNQSDREIPVVMELQSARLRELTWYLTSGQNVLSQDQRGIEQGRSSRLRNRYPVWTFPLPAQHTYTIYLRIRSDTTLLLPVFAGEAHHYLAHVAVRDFLDYAFVGFGACLLLIAFLLGLIQRHATYYLMALCMSGFLLYYLIFHGYLVWVFPDLPLWFNRNLLIVASFIPSLSITLFAIEYLAKAKDSRRKHNGLVAMAWLISGGIVLVAILPFRAGVLLLHPIIFLSYAIGSIVAFRSARPLRYPPNALFVLAWIALFIATLILLLQFSLGRTIIAAPINIMRTLMPAIFCFFTLAAYLQKHLSDRDRMAQVQARRQTVQAQLAALRYQLNPHFLFNTLNTIEALSDEAPERIPALIQRLARFLRSRLDTQADTLATLSSELDIIKAYIAIEQIRFEDQLQVEYLIDPATLGVRVPELLLQPLVENAIKHGMLQAPPLLVRIESHIQKDTLLIRVANTGRLSTPAEGPQRQGIGLTNLSRRLKHQYDSRAQFILDDEEGWVRATVYLPLDEPSS